MAGLTLKWGTIKGWSGMNAEQVAILQRYHDEGVSMSVMAQKDTDSQRAAICELIDTMVDGDGIYNDWEGTEMTREAAKKYVMEYRR